MHFKWTAYCLLCSCNKISWIIYDSSTYYEVMYLYYISKYATYLEYISGSVTSSVFVIIFPNQWPTIYLPVTHLGQWPVFFFVIIFINKWPTMYGMYLLDKWSSVLVIIYLNKWLNFTHLHTFWIIDLQCFWANISESVACNVPIYNTFLYQWPTVYHSIFGSVTFHVFEYKK